MVLVASGCTAITASLLGWYFTGSYEVVLVVAAGSALWTAELFTGIRGYLKKASGQCGPVQWLWYSNASVPLGYGVLIWAILFKPAPPPLDYVVENLLLDIGNSFLTVVMILFVLVACLGIFLNIAGIMLGVFLARNNS